MKREIFHYNGTFELESGEVLDTLELCYHISVNPAPGSEVIWICHALTANSNPLEWWKDLTGKDKLFDPSLYTIICVNMLGSCYGSSGPSTYNKENRRYMLSFPKVTVRDIVKSQNLLREHLGIEKISLVIGGSIGGFQALEWTLMYPDVVANSVLIASNARVSPWGSAFNESQRMALLSDSTFIAQNDLNGGKAGLAAARSVALLSYRSHKGYGLTQKEEEEDTIFASRACSYQQYQGKKLCDRFDAYSYYILTHSVDSHNAGRGRGGIEKALGVIKAKIHSDFGHDGFLLEWESISKVIRKHVKFIR